MNLRQWVVSPLDKERAARIAERYAIPFFLAMLLEIRGFREPERIEALLSGEEALSDPLLMKDMDKAVARVRRAVEDFEKIAVYGDYDADGVTATAMVYTYLEAVGADVRTYIPQREGEGYGMNEGAVRSLREQGVGLIVTVDNGISSVEEVALAKELGMDVVITDHHRPHGTLPAAAAVVDAWREDDRSPFKELCGAGVALKLLIALEDGQADGVLEEYAELAAIGTIADVVPMVGENRAIVRRGLRDMARSPSAGLDALLARCSSDRRNLSATGLAFTAIPRLNATGRMGTPDRAVQLLCADPEEAEALADAICQDNEERRRVEAQIMEEALESLRQDPARLYDRVLVVSGAGWHHGVIGIVAARLTERYGKPCFVIAVDGESAKGSGRSVEGFSLFDAVFSCREALDRFGGHPMAAGATLRADRVEDFRRGLNEYAKEVCPEMPAPVLRLDCRLNPAALTADLPRALRPLEPYGNGNPQPLFGLFGMELREIAPVGGGAHLRLTFQKRGAFLTCMRFGARLKDFPYAPGDRLDLAVSLDLGEYRGEERLTVSVRDLRVSGVDDRESVHSYRVYERYRRGEPLAAEDAALLAPTREQLAGLYRLLASYRGAAFEATRAVARLSGFNLGKLLLCLDMMEERGLVELGPQEDQLTAKLLPAREKVDIFASPVFQKLVARN